MGNNKSKLTPEQEKELAQQRQQSKIIDEQMKEVRRKSGGWNLLLIGLQSNFWCIFFSEVLQRFFFLLFHLLFASLYTEFALAVSVSRSFALFTHTNTLTDLCILSFRQFVGCLLLFTKQLLARQSAKRF